MSWWERSRHEDRRPRLLLRNRIVAGIRDWFGARDFVEIDPAAIQRSPGNETHLHAFPTELVHGDGSREARYLHTSPEFAMKKLLAAGESRIFALPHVYRNQERSALHHPEFTMLEWYRVEEPYRAVIQDAAELVALAARIGEHPVFTFRGRTCDALAEPETIAVQDAFSRFAGIDLLATLGRGDQPDRDEHDRETLARACGRAGIRIADDDTWSDLFSRVLVEMVEPRLGVGRPTILDRYPAAEAALARRAPDDPRVAERFELYVCGVELANGFGELTDPAEQRRRFAREMDEKARIYGERYPVDEEFLAALAEMPAASGVALGLDRLAMLAVGAEQVTDVIWTPVE